MPEQNAVWHGNQNPDVGCGYTNTVHDVFCDLVIRRACCWILNSHSRRELNAAVVAG